MGILLTSANASKTETSISMPVDKGLSLISTSFLFFVSVVPNVVQVGAKVPAKAFLVPAKAPGLSMSKVLLPLRRLAQPWQSKPCGAAGESWQWQNFDQRKP